MSIIFSINDAKICTKQAIYTSLLQGDAGGGVVRGNMIFGVISFMGESEKANAADLGFIDVCEYKDWIKKKTKKPIFG